MHEGSDEAGGTTPHRDFLHLDGREASHVHREHGAGQGIVGGSDCPAPVPAPVGIRGAMEVVASGPTWPPAGSSPRQRLEDEGRQAAASGAWPSACPYTVEGSRARLAWLDGYLAEKARQRRSDGSLPGLAEDMARGARTVLAQTIETQAAIEAAERRVSRLGNLPTEPVA